MPIGRRCWCARTRATGCSPRARRRSRRRGGSSRGARRPVARAPGSSTRGGSRSRSRRRRVPAGVGRPTPPRPRPAARGPRPCARSARAPRTAGVGARTGRACGTTGCTGPAGSRARSRARRGIPRVVTSAVRAPRRSVTALITTVLPWTNAPMSAGRSSERSSADSTPCWRRAGVVATFARTSEPSRRSTAARSVNVPPMSIASSIGPRSLPIRALYPLGGVDRSRCTGHAAGIDGFPPREETRRIMRWPARCARSARS